MALSVVITGMGGLEVIGVFRPEMLERCECTKRDSELALALKEANERMRCCCQRTTRTSLGHCWTAGLPNRLQASATFLGEMKFSSLELRRAEFWLAKLNIALRKTSSSSRMVSAVLCLASLLFHSVVAGADNNEVCAAVGRSEVSGFAVFTSRADDAKSFVQDLRPLIENTRAESGNLDYRMYVNPAKPGVIGFTERYQDFAALQAHLTAKHVTSIFEHEYYSMIRQGSELFGPWEEVLPAGCSGDDEEGEMVFYWTMNCTAQHIWDVITYWEDASWVAGEPNTTIIPLDENGAVVSAEEAERIGFVDPQGGLGPVAQRRTWPNGYFIDVRMLERNDTSFVTVQETLSELKFPNVTYDKFYVTISLHSDGLDPQVETRLRYHVRFTMKNGTLEEGRQNLKNDFYGPRIKFYQEQFNCSETVHRKQAAQTILSLYKALANETTVESVDKVFATDALAKDYLSKTAGVGSDASSDQVDVSNPVDLVATEDLLVVAVEDVVKRSISGTTVIPRIVQYQFDAWSHVVSFKVFDQSAQDCKNFDCAGAELVNATDHYYEVLKLRDLEQVRELFSPSPELFDPAGRPARTFESVYVNFFAIAKDFTFTRYESRKFVDAQSRQTAQLVDANITLEQGEQLLATPLQFFTFDNNLKVSKFEAFFTPRRIDFDTLDDPESGSGSDENLGVESPAEAGHNETVDAAPELSSATLRSSVASLAGLLSAFVLMLQLP